MRRVIDLFHNPEFIMSTFSAEYINFHVLLQLALSRSCTFGAKSNEIIAQENQVFILLFPREIIGCDKVLWLFCEAGLA